MNAETTIQSGIQSGADWRNQIFEVIQDHDIKQVYHVPDAGHSRLIEHCQRSNSIRTVPLTTEEEGIALDRKSTRLNSSHTVLSRMPASSSPCFTNATDAAMNPGSVG